MAKILLVEDDKVFCENVKDWLECDTHTVDYVHLGSQAFERLRDFQYDVVILDGHLPDIDGVDICKQIRQNGMAVLVLMLTVRSQAVDKATGLDAGADDYLGKPCDIQELSARIRALLRRQGAMQPTVLRVGSLSLNAQTREVKLKEDTISLSPREFSLLEFFMKHPNQVFSAEALLERIWSSESETSPGTVYQFINTLRKKLSKGKDSSPIKTAHGVGYKLDSSLME